jgi:two-component system, chemotaxis family, protein-glutamate methylesterase/glutaminase
VSLRVLVVDDSALYRQLVRNVLRDIPDVEVVGVAKTGTEALELIPKLTPQLLTLDVQMPDMNGLELLRELKQRRSPVKAIMLSSLTAEGTKVTTDALLAGAFDFIQKPSGPDAGANRDILFAALTEKLNAFRASIKSKLSQTKKSAAASAENSKPVAADSTSTTNTSSEKPALSSAASSKFIQAVVIGTSTGGPVALREVLPKLPSDLGIPVFVVQHMPANFTRSLADRIGDVSRLPISEGSHGTVVEANRIYIAPGGFHLRITRNQRGQPMLETSEDPPEHNCRPAVDYLFRSAAAVYGGKLLAVILTGMGRDGTEGCRLIKSMGGKVIAQHPEGCIVYGMPKAVIEEQLADRVVPLEKIADWIVRFLETKP